MCKLCYLICCPSVFSIKYQHKFFYDLIIFKIILLFIDFCHETYSTLETIIYLQGYDKNS